MNMLSMQRDKYLLNTIKMSVYQQFLVHYPDIQVIQPTLSL